MQMSVVLATSHLMLLLHYFVKGRSRSFAADNNEFIFCSACIGSENY